MDDDFSLTLAVRLDAERATKRRKFEAVGIFDHVCTICGEQDLLCLTIEHVAGRKHDPDAVTLVCQNHKAVRDAQQRAEPRGSDDPLNVFEVIGRWLLGLATYFEMMRDTLRRFGEFLIKLARSGYGADLQFE